MLRWSLILQEYTFDIIHIPGTQNVIADLLSRISNNQEEDVSKKIHKAKTAILEDIRQRTAQLTLKTGQIISDKQLKAMLSSNNPDILDTQSAHVLSHTFRDPDPPQAQQHMAPLDVQPQPSTSKHQDTTEEQQYDQAILDNMLQATTFQSGQMTREDFARLQKEDDYCNKVKQCLEQSPLKQNFRVKRDILLKLPEPVKGNLEDLQARYPTLEQKRREKK